MMALSNWATLALDHDGAPCNGIFDAVPGRLTIKIYKNWAYVSGDEVRIPGSTFSRPTFMDIMEGDLCLGPLRVLARRGPQEAVFLVCESQHTNRWFGGIGCYGYDAAEWVGVQAATQHSFMSFLQSARAWTHRQHDFDEWLARVAAGPYLQFNQGDAYICGRFGLEIPATAVGDTPPVPLLIRMFKQDDSA